jgi:hypothetical protein
LRLLNGLHKDRIVVFINRADQLPNPRCDAAAVKAIIEKRLRLEFPTLQIPVVYGSAWLGNLRLQADTADLPAMLQPAQVMRQAGPFAARNAPPDAPCSDERSRVARAMHMSSGMAEVSAAITRLMCTSSVAMLLRQIAVCLAELVRTAEVTDRAELQSIRELLDVRRQESAALRKRIGEEQQSLAAFEDHASALQASFQGVEAHFKELVGSATQMLRHRLCGLVRDFADGEADALLHALQDSPKQRAWRCDVLPLRDELEAVYLAEFEQAASDLARVEQFLYPQLKLIVASLLPNYRGNLLEVPAWPEGLTPSVAPLADKVTMDLGTSWWRRWFAGRRAAEERAHHLRSLIEEDFLKIADELVHEAEAHLGERVAYIMRRVNAINNGLRTGIERRSTNLAKERALLNGSGDEHGLQRFEAEQKQRADVCVRRQEACSGALAELGSVLEGLDGAQGEIRP